MLKDISKCFMHPSIIKEIFEEPMICLDCHKRYKYKHGVHDPFKKLANRCPECKSLNVLSKKDEEYYEKEMKPYLEARIRDDYQPNLSPYKEQV